MATKEGYYVAVAGPIGVGKTSLAKRLVERWSGTLVAERVDDNPLLAPFYRSPQENAFHLQLYFLVQRCEQQRQVLRLRPDTIVVSDYVFAKDDLFARLVLDEKQYRLYVEVVKALSPANVRADVVIYLQAGVEALIERIARRGRDFEGQIDKDYLAKVVNAYEDLFGSYDRTPLVKVNTETADLVHDDSAFQSLTNQVAEMAWMARPEVGAR